MTRLIRVGMVALFAVAMTWGVVTVAQSTGYGDDVMGFGTEVDESVIEAFNIHPAIPPDGTGLPDGSGTVSAGAEIYTQKCAHCHGATGSEGPFDVLVGPDMPVYGPQARRNIGNYWPYATTVYDFIKRAMPFDNPGTLTPDEVYAVTAWLLNQNGIIPEDAVMDRDTLPAVEMPNRDGFVPDPRPFPEL
jgi:S-disulfanyl-L-cysteine oxidoreductase SoxD